MSISTYTNLIREDLSRALTDYYKKLEANDKKLGYKNDKLIPEKEINRVVENIINLTEKIFVKAKEYSQKNKLEGNSFILRSNVETFICSYGMKRILYNIFLKHVNFLFKLEETEENFIKENQLSLANAYVYTLEGDDSKRSFFNLDVLCAWNSPLFAKDIYEFSPQTALNKQWKAALEQKGTDVTFLIDGKQLFAHLSILQINSEFFITMFNHSFKESKTKEIEIKGYSFEDFKLCLEFIYTGKISEKQNEIKTITNLFMIADQYLFTELMNWCISRLSSHLSSNPESYSKILKLSDIAKNSYDFKVMCVKKAETDKSLLKILTDHITNDNFVDFNKAARTNDCPKVNVAIQEIIENSVDSQKKEK